MTTIKIKPRETTESTGSTQSWDWVEVGVSHQLKINGDESWVSYKLRSRVREHENITEASKRVRHTVAIEIDQIIDETVEYVERKSK